MKRSRIGSLFKTNISHFGLTVNILIRLFCYLFTHPNKKSITFVILSTTHHSFLLPASPTRILPKLSQFSSAKELARGASFFLHAWIMA